MKYKTKKRPCQLLLTQPLGIKFKVFRRRNGDEKIIGNNLIISDEISDFYCFYKKKEKILLNFCILRKDSGMQYF